MKIPLAKPYLKGNELKYVTDCVKSGWIGKGDYITKFEDKFSKYITSGKQDGRNGCSEKGVKEPSANTNHLAQKGYSTAVCNGTVALHLALEALGIGKGDEVIVPNLTYIATANAVTYTGAKVVLCDVETHSFCIDPREIEKKITKRTKAIIPVHLYGNSCNMYAIAKIAKKHRLYVIEDCAEALGAEFERQKVGMFSDISCFSFFGNKIITCGEGGVCFTQNKGLDKRLKHLRNHAITSEAIKGYNHDCIGYNYRMTNIQAAIALAQLEKIEYILKERDNISIEYTSYLENRLNLLCLYQLITKDVNWLYSAVLPGKNINKLIKYLSSKGIESRPFFTPLNKLKPYKSNKKFPDSDYLAKYGINLPTYIGLTDEQIKIICRYINE